MTSWNDVTNNYTTQEEIEEFNKELEDIEHSVVDYKNSAKLQWKEVSYWKKQLRSTPEEFFATFVTT